MSSDSDQDKEAKIEVILETKSIDSSVEPPMEEWSSLVFAVPDINPKIAAFEEGLYHPGSGEICTKYIAQSDSSVFRHPYYNYPAVNDPGIQKALLEPEEVKIYPDDGQELYLDTCKAMKQCPVRIFHRSLLEGSIDLAHYGVDPRGVRTMAMALHYNKNVKVLNLTDNFLSHDACFHLGEMLAINATLKELNLSGCRIGPEGARRLFSGLLVNRNLRILNLNKNMLEDTGIEHLALIFSNGTDILKLYLRYNNITTKGARALAEAMEFNNKLTHLDLSWNKLFTPLGTVKLLECLAENTKLQELKLSWNALATTSIAKAIKNVMMAPNLRTLDLSSNMFEGIPINNIAENMAYAKKLKTLILSDNPMKPADTVKIITMMKNENCKIQNLYLENVRVNPNFIKLLKQLKKMESKKKTVIIHGEVLGAYKVMNPDMRDIVLNRSEYLAIKYKTFTIDIMLKIMQAYKEKRTEMIDIKDFMIVVQYHGIHYTKLLDNDLIAAIADAFPGPPIEKSRLINLRLLVDFIRRKFPDRKLPPTPPPEPEPEPEPLKTGKDKGKNKGKDKGKANKK